MKIAYVTSRYPAVSHTFILREVQALRALGMDVGTFSIRRAGASDIRGPEAEAERGATRALLPPPWGALFKAFAWAIATRPAPLLHAFVRYGLREGRGLNERLKWLAYTGEAVLFAHWLVNDSFSHLHCHFGNTGANTALIAAELAGIPFSFTAHGSELNDPHGFRLPLKAHHAAFVACVSKFGKARLMHVCHRSDWPKFHVVRCGQPETTPDPYPIGERPFRILCVARMSPEKAHFVLIDAFAQLLAQNSDAELTLIGDGPLRAEIEAYIAEQGCADHVTLTGALEPARVAEYYTRAHAVVLASFSEGVPVVLMEAFAHGRPVVATRVGGVPELVHHNESGYVVAPGDPHELAHALIQLQANLQQARKMGEKGHQFLQQEFDQARNIEKLTHLFQTTAPKVS